MIDFIVHSNPKFTLGECGEGSLVILSRLASSPNLMDPLYKVLTPFNPKVRTKAISVEDIPGVNRYLLSSDTELAFYASREAEILTAFNIPPNCEFVSPPNAKVHKSIGKAEYFCGADQAIAKGIGPVSFPDYLRKDPFMFFRLESDLNLNDVESNLFLGIQEKVLVTKATMQAIKFSSPIHKKPLSELNLKLLKSLEDL